MRGTSDDNRFTKAPVACELDSWLTRPRAAGDHPHDARRGDEPEQPERAQADHAAIPWIAV